MCVEMASSRQQCAAAPHLDKLKRGARSPLQMASAGKRASLRRANQTSLSRKCIFSLNAFVSGDNCGLCPELVLFRLLVQRGSCTQQGVARELPAMVKFLKVRRETGT